MKSLLRVIGICFIAAGLAACESTGQSSIHAWDLSKLNGSWQAVSYKEAKSTTENKADQNGDVVIPVTTENSTTSTPTPMKLFMNFDGSKAKTTVVMHDRDFANETTQDYRVENNFVVSKSKNADGSSKENRAQIIKITPDSFVMSDDKGNISGFKKVTDSDIEAAKATVNHGSVSNNNGCAPQPGLTCTEKPGLSQGQTFILSSDVSVPAGGYNYYVNGQQVQKPDLKEGQDFCRLTVATQNDNSQELELPKEYQKNGVDVIPKAANPYVLSEISWYVETVFFKGTTPTGDATFMVVCGTVQNGDVESKEKTSMAAIRKNMAGVFYSR